MNGFKSKGVLLPSSFLSGLGHCAALLIGAEIILTAGCTREQARPPAPAAAVLTAAVIQKDVPMEIPANGTVEAFSIVNITSRVDGQITKIHFAEGQDVEKGRLLFSIDDRPYQALRESARANLARDRIRLEKAQKDAERYADLIKKDYVTQAQYEQVTADAKSLAAIVKGDEAAQENAELNVSYCRITAPVSGRVGSILINEGNIVKANDSKPLTVLHQVRPVYVRFAVPEHELPAIKRLITDRDLKVIAQVPGKKNEAVEGRLTFMDNTVNPKTGTIDLKGLFENRDDSLWPGQFVKVKLVMGLLPQALVVPSEAVQMGQEGSYVFVVKSDLTVEVRPVTAGPRTSRETVIETGLTAGETVVTDGQLRLYPGAKIIPEKAPPASGEAVL